MDILLEHIALKKIQKQDPNLYQKFDDVVQQVKAELPAVIQNDFSYISKSHYFFTEFDGPFDDERLVVWIGWLLYNYDPLYLLRHKTNKCRKYFQSTLQETLKESKFIVSGYISDAVQNYRSNKNGFRKDIHRLQFTCSKLLFDL